MYHLFAKNEEMKNKKESKTSTPISTSWGPNSTNWDPQQHLFGPHLHILIHVINFVQITNLCPCHGIMGLTILITQMYKVKV
jgi:hypothetical protein